MARACLRKIQSRFHLALFFAIGLSNNSLGSANSNEPPKYHSKYSDRVFACGSEGKIIHSSTAIKCQHTNYSEDPQGTCPIVFGYFRRRCRRGYVWQFFCDARFFNDRGTLMAISPHPMIRTRETATVLTLSHRWFAAYMAEHSATPSWTVMPRIVCLS